MESMHWAYLIPVGVFFFAGAYLAADVDVSHAENVSTRKLRLMILCFGLACLYASAISWYFDLGSWRLRAELRWTTRYVFLFVGIILVLIAAFRSRSGLIKESIFFTKPHYDIEIGGKPEITPAERVNRLSDPDNKTQKPDRQS